jgi:hypothetical protein
VIPEVESLRDLGAKTNQEKQERTELEKGSPHFAFDAICGLGARKTQIAAPIYCYTPEDNPKA